MVLHLFLLFLLNSLILHVDAGLGKSFTKVISESANFKPLEPGQIRKVLGPKDGGPDFFLIGPPKTGTTSLHELLDHHKNVCRAKAKEMHYFDQANYYNLGTDFYLDFFPDTCKGRYIDATPSYFYNQEPLRRMNQTFTKEALSKKKFVVVLREPIAREFSWYGHIMKGCNNLLQKYMEGKTRPEAGWNVTEMCSDKQHCEPLLCKEKALFAQPDNVVQSLATFREYIDHNQANILKKGFYIIHFKYWLQTVRRDQMFVVSMTDLITRTASVMSGLADFLDISDPWAEQGKDLKLPQVNVKAVDVHMDCETARYLSHIYRPFNLLLYEFLLQPGGPEGEPKFTAFGPPKCSP